MFPGPDSPVRIVDCPRGYCYYSFTSGSGSNVSITRNCYNQTQVVSRGQTHWCHAPRRFVASSTGVVTTAGPGAVLEKAEGRPGRSARGEQVLHPQHHGPHLHRVSLRLPRLQQPGHQHPGGSKQQITLPDFNLALFRIQLSSCLCS